MENNKMSRKYNEENLKLALINLLNKYGEITTTLIDKEKNFPTRKVFKRVFGSLENACKAIGYMDYKINKFTITEAQKYLDQRNGQFILLSFNGVRAKNKTLCRKCNYIWEVSTDSLYRNNTFTNRCPNCFKIYQKNKQKRKQQKIKYIQEQKPIYKRNKKLLDSCLNEDLNFYYFLGVLFSDGNFDLISKRIILSQSGENSEILFKLAKYYDLKINREEPNKYYINFVAKEFFDTIINKYNVSNKKTYYPCDIANIKKEFMLAFIVGFVDGDGHIGKRTDSKSLKINIKLYKNWANNLNIMSKELYNYFNIDKFPKVCFIKDKITKENKYATITWGNQKVLFGLYKFIIDNNLIYMNRKWDKIKGVMSSGS